MIYRYDIPRSVLTSSILVLLICIPLWLCGYISLSFCGYGVDSAGRLYIGKDHEIEVIDNGEVVGTIQRFTDRGYAFAVLEDDTILISTSTTVYKLDVSGTVILEEWPDGNSRTFHELMQNKFNSITVSENEYSAARTCGSVVIERNGEVIYKSTWWENLARNMLLISMPLFFVSIWLIKWQPTQKNKSPN